MSTGTKKKQHENTTSVKIDKAVHRKLKIKAAKEGKTIKQLIEEKFKDS